MKEEAMQKNVDIKIGLGTFDFIKGIGMITIILTHSFQTLGVGLIWIPGSNFFMGVLPMFAFITGYFFKEKTQKKLFKTMGSKLIFPYMMVAIVTIVLFSIVHFLFFRYLKGTLYETLKFIGGFLLGLPQTKEIPFLGMSFYEASVVHYFISLFVAVIILNLIVKIKNEKIQIVLVGCCVLVSALLFHYDVIYFSIPQGLIYLVFCYSGYYVKKHNLLLGIYNNKIVWTIIVLITILESCFGKAHITTGDFNNIFLDSIGMIAVSLTLMKIGIISYKLDGRIATIVNKIGLYSYWIMCIHAVEMVCFPWYLVQTVDVQNRFLLIVGMMILKIVLITLGYILVKKISSIHYKRKMLKLIS